MNYLSYYVKSVLYDLIDYCYKEKVAANTLNYYKDFYIEFYAKVYSSFLGDYRRTDGRIRIMRVGSATNDSLIITLVHELSHHIDTINRGRSNHDKNFYKIHVELLIGAFDMNLISYESFMQCNTTAANNKKIKKLVQKENYVSKNINNYHSNELWVIVPNAYSEKEFFKTNEFKFNSFSKYWFKRCNQSKFENYKFYFLTRNNESNNAQRFQKIILFSKPGGNLIICLNHDELFPSTSTNNNKKPIQNNWICPKCGGKLVKRKGKYGEFFGCSNFPKCKYTKSVN